MTMRENIAGFLAGLIFGLGLAISGMAQPAVVQGFLDIAGAWDPRLIFVMAGGVIVTFIGYRIFLARKKPLWGAKFFVPTGTQIDAPLIGGAAIFGIGWGLSGYCPGPAVVSLASGRVEVIVFVIAMLIGMMIVRWIRLRSFANIAAKA
jgi:uncharacterized membrane protein YedE/YeeE